MADRSDIRARFLEQVKKLDKKKDLFHFLTREMYYKLMTDVVQAKEKVKKTSLDYRRLRRFNVIEIDGIKKLIEPGKLHPIRYVLPIEEMFDVLVNAHQATGHGGRDRMWAEVAPKYSSFTKETINIFTSLCESCQAKKSKIRRGLVVKPILQTEFNSRCQVDLIDMQSQPDQDYRFIMVYQDHLTKFVWLKPLKTKTAKEVARNLISIFTVQGAPSILHSDNGREFANQIIQSLKKLWIGLTIVHGKPRHSQSQGSVERANQDVENMLACWLTENNTKNWTLG